ncbi:MAG: enoyl-CoA hydratase/isomerase family protein [Lachnospiraceae bacterium]|nr:enoyl-CoA hydratase/isomerase family protein [Lachnospiraceae bacterium]
MNSENLILVEIKDHVMTITINRPEDKNRIDRYTCDEISKALGTVNQNPDINVVVITGNHDYFCTGGRVDATAGQDEQDKYIKAVADMQKALRGVAVPLIAAVEGDCTAGGHNIVIQSDIAIGRKGTIYGFPEVKRGGFPMFSMLNVIDTIPKKKLLYACYTGETYTAEDAVEYGVLTYAVEEEEFWPTVLEVVDQIKTKPRDLISIGRSAYYAMNSMDDEERNRYAKGALVDVLEAQSRYQKEAD